MLPPPRVGSVFYELLSGSRSEISGLSMCLGSFTNVVRFTTTSARRSFWVNGPGTAWNARFLVGTTRMLIFASLPVPGF